MMKHLLNYLILLGLIFTQNSMLWGNNPEDLTNQKKEMLLVEAINLISRDYDVYFTFDHNLVQNIIVVYETRKDQPVEAAISGVLAGTDLKFKLYDERFVILYQNDEKGLESLKELVKHFEHIIADGPKRKAARRNFKPVTGIPLRDVWIPPVRKLQNLAIDVSGTVMDQEGEVLIGVNVQVKGTNKGSATDFDGKYTLNNVNENAILIFSYVGYQTQEIPVNGRSTVDVTMLSDAQLLDEVVVVGYGTVEKKDLTGSVSSVRGVDIAKNLDMSLNSALQGRAAGVQVTSTGGAPGADVNVSIRAGSSISASNEPLYVIDGFPKFGGSNLDINPNDIESIEILKDASATAIYGSRGANGVVIITTKSAEEGKFNVSYDGYYGVQNLGRKLDVLSSQQFAEMQHYVKSSPANSGIGDTVYHDLSSWQNIASTDWQDIVLRSAPMQNHDLSFTGGSKNLKVSGSVTYTGQDGIAINTNFKRYTTRLNTILTLNKTISNNTSLYLSRTDKSGPNMTGSGGISYSILRASPFKSAEANSLVNFMDGLPPGGSNGSNPYADLTLPKIDDVNSGARINTAFNIKLLDDLTLRLAGGVYYNFSSFNSFYPTESASGYFSNGDASNNMGTYLSLLNENTLTYKKIFNGGHRLEALAGFTMQTALNTSNSIRVRNFNIQSLGYNNLSFGTRVSNPSSNRAGSGMESYLGRAQYSFLDKYLLTASIRADGSSKFQKDKWGYFPSGALAWKVTNEKFMQNMPVISSLKFRGSWGMTGNESVAPYSSFTTYAALSGKPPIVGEKAEVGLGPNQLGAGDLRWESTVQTNIGLDLGILENRILLTVDAYHKKSKDLLLKAPISQYSGFTSVLRNVGDIEVKGLEFDVNTVNLTGKFKWNTNFNISFTRSNVLKLNDNVKFFYLGSSGNPTILHMVKVGEPLGSMYGYVYDGINHTQEEYSLSPIHQSIPTYVGGRRYKDINNDGVINSNDQTVIGNGNPKFFGGISNNFSYGPFELSALFTISYGNDIINAYKGMLETTFSGLNSSASLKDAWTPENPQRNMSRKLAFNAEYNWSSTYLVEDGSYLRLKNIVIAYNLSQSLLKRLPIRNLRIYLSGDNLLTFTHYTGYDPEVNLYNSITRPGIDHGAYPRGKIYILGLKANF